LIVPAALPKVNGEKVVRAVLRIAFRPVKEKKGGGKWEIAPSFAQADRKKGGNAITPPAARCRKEKEEGK